MARTPAPSAATDAGWCLFLDVDGTLVDIAPTPDAVRVDDPLKQLLLDVRGTLAGAVALVSGRTLSTIDALFAPQRWPAAGMHGVERRDAAGRLHLRAVEGCRLDPARVVLHQTVARVPGTLLEDKGHALALHYRAVPDREGELRRVMRAVAAALPPGFHLLEGKCVFELKPAVTKADAVRAFLGEAPFAGRRPIYVGDDVTDLDGFAAAEEAGGLSIAVGDDVQARARLSSPQDVRSLLADLAAGRSPAS